MNVVQGGYQSNVQSNACTTNVAHLSALAIMRKDMLNTRFVPKAGFKPYAGSRVEFNGSEEACAEWKHRIRVWLHPHINHMLVLCRVLKSRRNNTWPYP